MQRGIVGWFLNQQLICKEEVVAYSKALSRNLVRETTSNQEKTFVWISGVRAQIQIRDLSNMKQKDWLIGSDFRSLASLFAYFGERICLNLLTSFSFSSSKVYPLCEPGHVILRVGNLMSDVSVFEFPTDIWIAELC
jgi:hypothetical protein